MNKMICSFCGREFVMGMDGVYEDGNPDSVGCDDCLGIVRDSNGEPWTPTDEVKIFETLDGTTIQITREQALRGKQ